MRMFSFKYQKVRKEINDSTGILLLRFPWFELRGGRLVKTIAISHFVEDRQTYRYTDRQVLVYFLIC